MSGTVACRSGGSVTFDSNGENKFRFKPGHIVHFTKSLRNGKVALIRGVSDGLLWFSVFRSVEEAQREEALKVPVDTASCRVDEEFIRQYGWVIDDRKNMFLYQNSNAGFKKVIVGASLTAPTTREKMLRQSRCARYYWSRYRFPTQMPKFDGPPPKDAPQNMNNTKTNEYIDPVDDKFPVSIRGNLMRPDVPEDQYVDSWYVCTSMTHHLGDFRPWSASAPANAYRFRPFNEFDSKGREYVKKLHEFSRYDPRKSRAKGQRYFPFREAYLTLMASGNDPTTPPPTLETVMDRAVIEKHQHGRVLSPLMRQWDVGRVEPTPSCAGKIPVDSSVFPFRWNTEDWYEYEIAKVRNKRFVFENSDEAGIEGSEVTYRIILEGFWDHHVAKLAEDICAFLRDVGRQVVEEKIKAVRRMLESAENGDIDPEIVECFNLALKGPFGGKDCYDKEEVANFVRSELSRLEEQCVAVINRCNVPIAGFSNLYDPQASWPYVEHLEPWVRMAEFWTSSSDTSFTELEMSTTHYEFRKYFRVVVVKLPFQSTEFEQRIYSIRHWLHRQTSCEFHTIYRRNVVHDASVFPTEHDPSIPTSHEHHRMFSFALDWQSSPVGFLSVEAVRKGDTWELVAERLGCSVEELQESNSGLTDLVEGISLTIPGGARRRLPSFGATPQVLPLTRGDAATGERRIRTWEQAAALLDCSVEDLQQANGYAALTYQSEGPDAGFDESILELNVPHTSWVAAQEQEFSATESVFPGDTWESVAQRLQCTPCALREANQKVEDLSTVAMIVVPPSARAPRRRVNPQLRSQAATDALLAKTIGEQGKSNLESLPHIPENAAKFPHEYHTTTSRFPTTPRPCDSTEDWLAYTAKYLDKDLSMRQEPTPLYNVNKLWPLQQIPGKIDHTPFEEDQTWFMHPIPVQQMELHHPEKDLQDLPFVNHEQFPRSIEWTAP